MGKKLSARRVAFSAVFTALAVAFMYIGCVLPTGQLGFLGLASLLGIAATVEFGLTGGVFVWLGGAILGLLILPSKTVAWLFTIFFGPYPVVKALSEKGKRVVEWCVKMAFFNLALSLAVFALKAALVTFGSFHFGTALLYVLGNAVFVLFDIAVTRAVAFYMQKLHPRLRRSGR